MAIRHLSSLKGNKSVDITVISMARCLAAYLCYLYSRKSKTIFSEHLLRIPFIEVSQAYKWDYECEFRLKDDPEHENGSYKKIDHVIAYNKQVVAIEAKFRRKENNTIVDLKKEIDKLEVLFTNDPRIKPFEKKYAYIFVASEQSVFDSLKYKGIGKTNDISEKELREKYDKKRNIFKLMDAFVTSSRIGRNGYCVKAIKVMGIA
jgi:hypothetical protein